MTTVTYPSKRGNKAPSKFKTDKVANTRTNPYGDNAVGQPGRDVGEGIAARKPHPTPPMDDRSFNIYTKSGAKTYRGEDDKGSYPTSRYRSRRP